MLPGFDGASGKTERRCHQDQRDQLGIKSGPSPNDPTVAEPIAAELTLGGSGKGEQGSEACRYGRHSQNPRSKVNADGQQGHQDVIENRKGAVVARERPRESKHRGAEDVRQGLVAPLQRVTHRPLRNPRVHERLAARQ